MKWLSLDYSWEVSSLEYMVQILMQLEVICLGWDAFSKQMQAMKSQKFLYCPKLPELGSQLKLQTWKDNKQCRPTPLELQPNQEV